MKLEIKTRKIRNKKIIAIQAIFLIGVFVFILFAYPRTNVNVKGNAVMFDSINTNTITISENPDFSNPRFIDINKNVTIYLKPGTYYWKAGNGLIEGLSGEFVIDSELGLAINRDENETNLVNVGNVKINVTKTGDIFVGYIILEPNETEKIEDKGNYTGRQN